MKIFLTGGTGFIGQALAFALQRRGDEVVALVRNPGKAAELEKAGCRLVQGDITDAQSIRGALDGCDAAIHCAAVYQVGVLEKDRPAMYEANVRGTENVLRIALELGTPRVVYVSTVASFGNTKGRVVDETYEHDGDYTSYYDETKHQAHLLAKQMIHEKALPGIIVQPGSVYGPHDTSQAGEIVRRFLDGKIPMKLLPELGVSAVHRDDVVDGIMLALDKGKIGESYVLAGDNLTMGDIWDEASRAVGKKPARFTLPTGVLKAMAPLAPYTAKLTGFPPNLKEIIKSSDNVTFWASSDKARRELGYEPRPISLGIRQTLQAEGRI